MKNAIYLFRSSSNRQMMGLILTTAEGGTFLVDGGYDFDAVDLLNYIKEITGEAKPHIDAIWLTHPHVDHIPAVTELIGHHADEFSFDKIFFRFPSAQFLKNDDGSDRDLTEFYSLMPKFADRMILPFDGDSYSIRGAKFDVLYTTDAEFTTNECNNASTVFFVTIAGKKILITGDCGREAGDRILHRYGDGLKADICQMAHHGQNGVNRNFYERVRPDVCIWCAPDWLWNNDPGTGYNTGRWRTVETRGWMDEISPDRRDVVLMDGNQCIEL